MLINAELLLQYQRCKRRSYLDIHGDISERDVANDLLVKLQQDKIAYQKSILARWNLCKPDYPRGNWQIGNAATLELMQQGVECIYHGVLLANYSEIELQLNELVDIEDAENSYFASTFFDTSVSSKYTLLSRPDLLVKQSGKSCFGNWMYVPINIELGKRPKQEYQVVAAFHAQILATIQQAESEKALLIFRGKDTSYTVDLHKWKPQMQGILQELIQALEEQTAPEVFISRQRCHLCHWYSSCYAIAQSQRHLSLIPGITPVRYTQLQTLGINTLESLVQANPTVLENLPGFDSEVACKLILQAQSVLENRPLLLSYPLETPTLNTRSLLGNRNSDSRAKILQTKSEDKGNLLPIFSNTFDQTSKSKKIVSLNTTDSDSFRSSIELYFDIEAQPDLNLDYLLGVLVVDHQTNTETFYSLLAEQPEDEILIWQQFLDLMWQYPDAPIYHFCVYESDTVKRLAKLYGTSHKSVQPILNRFVDVYEKLTQNVALPIESYALKAIARWLGFEWRDPQASGAKCIYWYDQWLKTGDRNLLEIIQRYNEDDCHATRSVKDWLVNFFQQTSADYLSGRYK